MTSICKLIIIKTSGAEFNRDMNLRINSVILLGNMRRPYEMTSEKIIDKIKPVRSIFIE